MKHNVGNYEQHAPNGGSRPRALVIGSGFGGLAAAIRLSVRGYKVTVLEKLDRPGGRGRVFSQDGFTFDAGPTIVTAPFLFEELWRMCGRRLEDDVDLRPLSPFYKIRFHDGEEFTYWGEDEAMRAEVARICPSDLEGYERFMQVSKTICEIGFEQLGDQPFGSLKDMARILPDLFRLSGYRTVHGLVSKHIKHPRLRQVFSFHPLLIGGDPFTTTAVYCLIAHLERKWGVHFAMGGTGKLVEGMVGLLRCQGGNLQLSSEVSEILVENGRAAGVRLTNGRIIPSDVVVSNADSAWTYRHMLPADLKRRWSPAKVERARYSMSLFVWYFGTRRRYEDVGHHTIMLGARYRELLQDVFKRKVVTPDFSLYLHRPTATDPSLAPDGCDTFYVLSPVPHLDSAYNWREGAEPYRQAIEKHLSATLLPGLADEIVTSRMMTPIDFREHLLAYKGAAFGLEPIFSQSAWFRPHNRSEDIDQLFLVGAGTHPGAGLPGVLSSARVLDKVVPDATIVA